jgi:hypothetical protein
MRPTTVMMALVLAGGLWLAGAPAAAHHAFAAEFDAEQPVTLRGTVTSMEWVNPHCWLHVDVKEPDGRIVNWLLELGPPNGLFRRGWRRDSVPPGAEVVVKGYRAKNGKPIANAAFVTLPDGRELFGGSSGTGAPDDPDRPR